MDDVEKPTEMGYDIVSMERDHGGQLTLFNDLKAAVRSGAPDSLVYALLDELVEHTDQHFLSEQLVMKLHAYEAYESHLLEHERLLVEVQNLKRDLESGTETDKSGLIEALRSWLIVHIQTADKKLAEYLSNQVVRESPQQR